MIRNYIIYTIIILMGWEGYTQNELKRTYSLTECITIALDNNLDLKSTNIRAHSAKINHQQSKANLLPSVNGDFSLGVNTGRSIDPFTNDFINQELTFSNAGLSIGATIFNGFRLINITKQNRLNRKASEMEVEAAKQDLTLNVTLAYLRVLNSNAVLELAKTRLETTKKQLKIQEDLYENESGNPADYTDILGQVANDETSIVVSESNFNNSKLDLIRLLNIKENIDVETKTSILDFEKYNLSADQVYDEALQNLATFKAGELRMEATKKGVSVAKAQFTPKVSVFGGVNTNYSSAAQTFIATGTNIVNTEDFVTVNGQNIPVMGEQTIFESQNIGYRDQLDNNLILLWELSLEYRFLMD